MGARSFLEVALQKGIEGYPQINKMSKPHMEANTQASLGLPTNHKK